MAVRRRVGRVSSAVLPPEASPYDALRSIIGAALRKHYSLPDHTPTYMQALLDELDEQELDDKEGSKPDPPRP